MKTYTDSHYQGKILFKNQLLNVEFFEENIKNKKKTM